MAKTYLDIVKYMVISKFSIGGLVDKPDIIGAVFGQTEGLLGDELDLRELQKGGKIGRIEIDLSQSGTKTYGKLFLPASLDRVETCILGAAVESVDRVGPFDASFEVEKIEDTRTEKRRKILERAKVLIKQLLNTEVPDSKELAELVQSDVKASEIVAYGPEHLPAGPDLAKSSEVVVVEGRADVITLLRNGFTNVVAMGGATSTIPKSIIDLGREKELTIFVDGDRGGDLIIRSLLSVVEVDYIAKAPDGKEVEELTRKEIIKSLRTRTPTEQYLSFEKAKQERQEKAQNHQDRQERQDRRERQQFQQPQQRPEQRPEPVRPEPEPQHDERQPAEPNEEQPYIKDLRKADDEEVVEATLPGMAPQQLGANEAPATKPFLESALLAQLANGLVDLSGTLRSRFYGGDGSVVWEGPIRELLAMLQDARGIYAIVLDGVITQRLVELSLEKGVKAVYGIRANPMPKKHTDIILYTKEQGKLE